MVKVAWYFERTESGLPVAVRRVVTDDDGTQDESPHLDATPRFPAEAVGSLLEEE